MKKALVATLVLLVLGAAMMPAWAQGTQVSFNGVGNARALDLSAPALRAIPGASAAFKGLTVGLTSSTFDISPSGKSVSGLAAGQCEFIASSPDTGSLPCTASTMEASSLSSPGGVGTCAQTLPLGVVDVGTACGKSSSSLTSDGLPNSLNNASVLNTKILADLSKLGLPVSAELEAQKDLLVDTVIDLTGTLLSNVPSQAQTDALKDSLNTFLNSIKDGNQFAAIEVGAANTNVVPNGGSVSLTSEAAGAKIGLLGITNPLVDGLVIVEISSGVAKGSFNGSTGLAEASAVGPLATLRVRDVADLVTGDYISLPVQIDLQQLNTVLGNLNGSLLETTVEIGNYTREVQRGKSVSAFTSGVTIHALKGLGATSVGAKDGGLFIRVASADVKLAGDITSVTPCCALATTGGPVYAYLAGAVLLALMALATLVIVRRLRTTTS